MELTCREWWTAIHGMGFGSMFILGFTGGVVGLHGLRSELMTPRGIAARMLRLKVGIVAMAVAAWGTVITGTWIVYPWYRYPSPNSPSWIIFADEATRDWHEFGMEWKEHVAWLSPILATLVAFIVLYYGVNLVRYQQVRRAALGLFVLSFVFAAIAGAFGAFITKIAAVK